MWTRTETHQERQRLLKKLEKQRQGLYNQMEFVEILAQFWPLPNMAEKVERLQQEIRQLDQQKHSIANLVAC